MDISPDLPTTTSADAAGTSEHERVPDAEIDSYLAAERTANDYHP